MSTKPNQTEQQTRSYGEERQEERNGCCHLLLTCVAAHHCSGTVDMDMVVLSCGWCHQDWTQRDQDWFFDPLGGPQMRWTAQTQDLNACKISVHEFYLETNETGHLHDNSNTQFI